jgi:hypothetical protein
MGGNINGTLSNICPVYMMNTRNGESI